MTPLIAFFMVWDAQKTVFAIMDNEKTFLSEHPDLEAAINTLRQAERELRSELKGVVR